MQSRCTELGRDANSAKSFTLSTVRNLLKGYTGRRWGTKEWARGNVMVGGDLAVLIDWLSAEFCLCQIEDKCSFEIFWRLDELHGFL